jgi:hypothetical protein
MNGRKKIKQSTVIQVMNMAYTMESYLVKSEVKGRSARTIAILRILFLALDIISLTFGFLNSSDGKVTPRIIFLCGSNSFFIIKYIIGSMG